MTDPTYVYRDRDPRFEAFDGKPVIWPYYSAQLHAMANKCDYGGMYLGITVLASKAVSTAARSILLSARLQEDKDAIKSYDANSNAYTGLLLTISPKTDAGKVTFSIVENAKSTDLPDGDAKAAYDQLEAKYRPKNAPTLVSLEKQFRDAIWEMGEIH